MATPNSSILLRSPKNIDIVRAVSGCQNQCDTASMPSRIDTVTTILVTSAVSRMPRMITT